MRAHELVNSIYGLGKFYYKESNGRVLGILSAHVRRHIDLYSLDQLSQVLSSLSRVGVVNAPLLSDIVRKLLSRELDVKTCSSRNLVNLMVSFARFGVRPSRKIQVWEYLANEIVFRSSDITVSDRIAAIYAYSIMHVSSPHIDLFQACVNTNDDVLLLSPSDVCKYIYACSRVQYRDLEFLALFADSIRENIGKFTNEQIRKLYVDLDKLGIEVKEISQLQTVPLDSTPQTTWYPQRVPTRQFKKVSS